MKKLTKICRKCNEKKEASLNFFYYNPKTSDGLRGWCIDCEKERNSLVSTMRNDMERRKFPIPFDKCVYAIKKGSEIVYIGESSRTSKRLNYHFNSNGDESILSKNNINKLDRKKKYSWSILWHGDDDSHRLCQEKELIHLHQPKYNTVHK